LETTNVMMKSILTTIVFLALAVSGLAQTRSVIVNTSGVVQSPTNFWSADVTNARSGLGLGTAATNPATAFQPSSLVLSNLASNNAVNLTNLRATNIVGTLSITQGGTGSTNAADARTAFGLGTAATNPASAFQLSSAVLSNLATSNGANLTNIQASNLVGTITTNLGIQFASITATNGESIFLDLSVLDEMNAVQATFGTNTNLVGIGSLGISFGSSSVAAATRTNLGLGLSALTNTDTTNFRTAIGLGTTNKVSFDTVSAKQSTGFSSTTLNGIQWQNMYPSSNGLIGLYGSDAEGTTTFGINIGTMSGTTVEIALFNANRITFYEPLEFNNTTNRAITRTNLSLGWSALTNTNTAGFNASLYGSGTNPVLYNTNGEVVSPTNFWQVAPIVTRFVEFDPATNATTNIVAARNLHIHSLAISRTGVTSTITLPTNGVFNGDIALVVHQGPTSSVTAVRTAGAGTNLVTFNQFDEAVEFVYYNNVWQFNHNRSFVEPIYFSGTNAAALAAASRTNLSLGWSALTNPQSSLYSGTATTLLGYVAEINPNSTNLTGFNVLAYTNTNTLVVPANLLIAEDAVPAPRNARNVTVQGSVTIRYPFSSPTTIYANNSITATDESSYTNTLVAFGSNSVTFSALTLSSDLTLGSGDNIVLSTTTGTKIGTATNQLLGFYNQTPIARPSSTGVTTNGFTQGSGNNVHPSSTFTGGIGTNAYTISDVVAHLKSLGLLAP